MSINIDDGRNLESCTTWDVKKITKTIYILGSTANLNWLAGFLPSTVLMI